MTDILKVLGQIVPTANVLTDLYTVPLGVQTSISSITICNQDAIDVTFSVSIVPGGVADNPKQYIYYNTLIYNSDSFIFTGGVSLASGDVVRVSTTSSLVSFNIFGVEVS